MAKLFTSQTSRKFLAWIIPPVVFVFIKLLYLTCKKNFHIDQNTSSVSPCLYAFWHGELLMMPFVYRYYTGHSLLDAVISQHFDGELVARYIELFGGGVIRGSSSKGGLQALRGALQAIQKGRDVGITPDGPRGPRHSVAEGIVAIASLKKVPIVTVNCKPSSYWKLRSWDQFCIPKPFSTLDFYIGKPFFVHDLSKDEAQLLIQKRLSQNAV